jgi:hypothetical protein
MVPAYARLLHPRPIASVLAGRSLSELHEPDRDTETYHDTTVDPRCCGREEEHDCVGDVGFDRDQRTTRAPREIRVKPTRLAHSTKRYEVLERLASGIEPCHSRSRSDGSTQSARGVLRSEDDFRKVTPHSPRRNDIRPHTPWPLLHGQRVTQRIDPRLRSAQMRLPRSAPVMQSRGYVHVRAPGLAEEGECRFDGVVCPDEVDLDHGAEGSF